MRILYLTEGYTVHDQRYLTKLGQSGNEIFYIPLYSERAPDSKELPTGITPAVLAPQPLESTTDKVAAIARAASAIQPDLVQAGPLGSSAYLAALAGLAPLVSMSFAYDILWEAEHDIETMKRVKTALKGSAGLLCDCRTVEEAAKRESRRPDLPVARFPWGIDLEHFRCDRTASTIREDLGWSQNIILVSNRSWEPLYQVPLAIKSFAQAQSVMPQLRMILINSGSQATFVQQEIDSLGVRSMVHLPGRISQEHLPAYLSASDIYLSCSQTDGASISLIEAMACGLRFVVSDIPSNREWIEAGAEGMLCDANAVEAFASALIGTALAEKERIAAISQANRRCVENLANWDRNFPLLLDLYTCVLGTKLSNKPVPSVQIAFPEVSIN